MDEKRARAAMLAHRAAFDVLHAAFDVEDTVIRNSLEEMAYVGALMADETTPEAGTEPVDVPLPAHTADCFNEQVRAAHKERDASVSNLNLRLAYARVVIALADVMLTRTWKARRGEGAPPTTSDLEALGSALEAFEHLDAELPRVSV